MTSRTHGAHAGETVATPAGSRASAVAAPLAERRPVIDRPRDDKGIDMRWPAVLRAIEVALVMGVAACGALACGHASSPSHDESSSESSSGESDGAETTKTTGTTAAPTSTTSGDDSGSSSESSGAPEWDCDPVVPGTYGACRDERGMSNPSTCGWMGTGESVGFPLCIQAALVENGMVCSIQDCIDRCDCFAPPATGTATVECMDGVVADHKVCGLQCGNGEVCPDGMECSYMICVWPPQL